MVEEELSKGQIFVSCGQRTIAERELGKQLCDIIRKHGVFEPYFAEFQSSFSGLNENILDALARTSGIVTVLHARGTVAYGDGNASQIRASVWVEQEIAIAAFIQRTTKHSLHTAAYIQAGVGREGIRELLQLNPMSFVTDKEILIDLSSKIETWKPKIQQSLSGDERGKLDLHYAEGHESGVRVIYLIPTLTNKGQRANEYSCMLEVPRELLDFSKAVMVKEIGTERPGYRRFLASDVSERKELFKGLPIQFLNLAVSTEGLFSSQKALVYKSLSTWQRKLNQAHMR